MKSTMRTIFSILIFAGVVYVGYQAWMKDSEAQIDIDTVDDLVSYLLEIRSEQTLNVGEVDFGDDTQINILLLGLDERKEETELKDAHCDAIHMFTLNIEDWTMMITSVPRGTSVYIPGGPYEETDYYLANACAFAGLEYGISQIESIVGVKADYVATVGFSQTTGILRLLDLPAAESLQWLRHRQSYQIGEPQRLANQATFMKDVIVDHIDRFESDLTIPLQYVLFSFVDTDLPFSFFRTLLKGYIESDIHERPDDIATQLRPYYETQELHFDLDNYEEQLESLIDFLRPYLNDQDLSELPFALVQETLINFINEQISLGGDLTDIFDKQLWLQIENDENREALHYEFIEAYAQQLLDEGEDATAVQIVTDYVFEKKLLEVEEWEDQGRALLESMLLP